jgi:hypothetical protein
MSDGFGGQPEFTPRDSKCWRACTPVERPGIFGGGIVNKVTTDQAQSALILLSAIAYALERNQSYRLYPTDLKWIKVILELMPQMPLEDEAA